MKVYSEREAEKFLEKNNFAIVKREFLKNSKEIDQVKIDFPWVMKASGKKIIHKKKIGAVRIGISSINEAKKVFAELKKIPGAEGVLVEEQVSGRELFIGLKKTPEFGEVIAFGSGGSNVENKKDISFRVLTKNKKDFESLISDTLVGKKLSKLEIQEITKNLSKMEKLSNKYKCIYELDINPLILNKNHAFVADARLSIV